jgi:polyvinyl alcohol dehydrogenase (cytochrome)
MSNRSRVFLALLATGLGALVSTEAVAQTPEADPHPGRAIYQRQCAACHEGGDPRAPALSTIQAMNAADLRHVLTEGSMATQAANLSNEERNTLVQYLAAAEISHDDWIANMMCPAEARSVDLSRPVVMARVGIDFESTRRLTADAAGLTTRDMEDLELAWAIAFPGVTGLRSAPVIVGSTLFYAAASTRKVLALDAESGCVQWVYDSPAPFRSSITLGELGDSGRKVLYFSDGRAQIHAVDAQTGEGLWVVDGQADPGVGMLTGSPIAFEDRVIVPVSASGVTTATNPNYECCSGRGAVVVLDAATGERQWVYFTMEEAQYTGEVNAAGARLRGPSGAPIWTTPTVDVERRRIYVTTGQNTSLPATPTSNSVIALDLDSGDELWVFQAVANDVWNMACTGRPGPNCPGPEDSILEDWDFGGSAILVKQPDGSELLLAGQKSGHLWALDPEDGSVVWQQRVGEGGPLGGNHWGIAVDGQRVFLPINDPFPNGNQMSGMYAFDIASGEALWQQPLSADCSGGRQEFAPQCQSRYGLSAAPLVVDGAVVSAAIDGRVYIFDGADGRLLFEYDTARPFVGINGVEGNGGAIDSHSIAAGAGMVFIASGYGSFSQPPGNVLLGFRPRSN